MKRNIVFFFACLMLGVLLVGCQTGSSGSYPPNTAATAPIAPMAGPNGSVGPGNPFGIGVGDPVYHSP